jgi:hypothetical protein
VRVQAATHAWLARAAAEHRQADLRVERAVAVRAKMNTLSPKKSRPELERSGRLDGITSGIR